MSMSDGGMQAIAHPHYCHHYWMSGLVVESAVAFVGQRTAAAGRPADVTIRPGPVPERIDQPIAEGPTWQYAEGRFLLVLPTIARFLIEAGRSITFEPAPHIDADDIAALLCGSVFGILLHQRGAVLLHASAVEVGGRAMLFCGASGTGKSTLAAALVMRGYRLIAEDQGVIATDTGIATVVPDGAPIRLWEQAVSRLRLGDRRGPALRRNLRKFAVDIDTPAPAETRIGAAYMLFENRPSRQAGIARVNVTDAVTLITANSYRPLLVHHMTQREAYFRASVAIQSCGGVFSLIRPLRFTAIDETIGWLEDHWAQLGLAVPA